MTRRELGQSIAFGTAAPGQAQTGAHERVLRAEWRGRVPAVECYFDDFVAPGVSWRAAECAVEVEDGGVWKPRAVQVERWSGDLFERTVRMVGAKETVAPNDVLAIHTGELEWSAGQTRRIRVKRAAAPTAIALPRVELRFDRGRRDDEALMRRHNMPDGRPVPLDPRLDVHVIDEPKSYQHRKGYAGFSVNPDLAIAMPDGSKLRTAGYFDVVQHAGSRTRLLAKMKCRSTANMADPVVQGGCTLVPYHIFEGEPGSEVDICCGYPSWQIQSDLAPLYLQPDTIGWQVAGPVRHILRASGERYYYDANPLLQRPCASTVHCLVYGAEPGELRLEYRIAVQGYGSFAFKQVRGLAMQMAGLQLAHSHYERMWYASGGELKTATSEKGGIAVPVALDRSGFALHDPEKKTGANTLVMTMPELFIDAYRPEHAHISAWLPPDRQRPERQYLPWHPRQVVVEDRVFPVGRGFMAVIVIGDARQKGGQLFQSTIYSETQLFFRKASSPDEALSEVGGLGRKHLVLEPAV